MVCGAVQNERGEDAKAVVIKSNPDQSKHLETATVKVCPVLPLLPASPLESQCLPKAQGRSKDRRHFISFPHRMT